MSLSRRHIFFAFGPPAGDSPAPAGDADASQACIPNISPRERQKRLAAGVIQFVITLAILAALLASGADRWWRLPLFLFFWGAAVGFFQWRDKT